MESNLVGIHTTVGAMLVYESSKKLIHFCRHFAGFLGMWNIPGYGEKYPAAICCRFKHSYNNNNFSPSQIKRIFYTRRLQPQSTTNRHHASNIVKSANVSATSNYLPSFHLPRIRIWQHASSIHRERWKRPRFFPRREIALKNGHSRWRQS